MLGRQKRFLLIHIHIKAKYLLSEEPSNNDKQIQHIVKDEIEQVTKNQKLNYLFFDRDFTLKDTTNQSLSQ
jgi:ABC-type dipeptide/oligopeptide/nickel transport system ATPase subunit